MHMHFPITFSGHEYSKRIYGKHYIHIVHNMHCILSQPYILRTLNKIFKENFLIKTDFQSSDLYKFFLDYKTTDGIKE